MLSLIVVAATAHVAAQEAQQQAAPRRGGRGVTTTEQVITDGESSATVTDKAIAELVAWKTDHAKDLLDDVRSDLGETSEFKAAEGLLWYNKKKVRQALDRLEKVASSSAEDPMPPYFVGQILQGEREYDDANDAWLIARDRAETLVESNPNDARAQYYLGAASLMMKKIGPARTAIAAAEEGEFDPRLCGFQLGLSYVQTKEWQKAKKAFDGVLELDPLFAPAYLHRGLTWSKLGRNDKMAADLERFIELAPDSPDADTARAMLGAYAG
jgi:tetratricopeptide (TPR) repeat protein